MPPPPDKPRLRGASHALGFFLALVAGVALVCAAPAPRARVAAAIFAGSLALLLGVSGLFHRRTWSPRAFWWLQRADHAAIYVLIAGTYTPFCVLLEPNAGGLTQLALMWGAAAIGVAKTLLWPSAPRRLNVAYYVLMGWLPVLTGSAVLTSVTSAQLLWLGLGGGLYTVGAVVFALGRPDPVPHIFGYHEIFHLLVVAAAACHFVAVEALVLTGPG